MAESTDWRSRRGVQANASSGTRWSSGSNASHGGSGRHSRRGGKKSGRSKVAKVLPTLPAPFRPHAALLKEYAALVPRVKPQWLDNPKNIVYLYTQARLGAPPPFQCTEGFVTGWRDPVFRCTAVLDEEHNIVATGDGKSQKEAEKAAALDGMFLLVERDFVANPPPSVNAAKAPAELSVTLSDGATVVSLDRAREFIDWVCHTGHFGKPDVAVTEASERRGRRTVTSGWHAAVLLAGTEVGVAHAGSKKLAQNMALLNTAVALEKEDPEGWRRFHATVKAGAPIGRAPHVNFRASLELEEDMRVVYDNLRRSELYEKRPRTTAAPHAFADAAPAALGARRSALPPLSEERHQEKSAHMLAALNEYQTDERVKDIRTQRHSLPVMQKSGDLLVKIEMNQVTICMAATGSGKTTQIPQILLDDYILRGQGSRCNIICTQPRRIAAISVAQRVARERGEPIGQTIGYQVRFDHRLPRPHGSITFCTTGVFLRRLQSALNEDRDGATGHSFLDDLTHIVVDEVHERDVETDLLLVVVKRLLAERAERGKNVIRLVLMSATIDPTLFQAYFTELSPHARATPVVDIPGRSFPVDKHYLDEVYTRLRALDLPRNAGGWVWNEKNVRDYLDREIMRQGGLSPVAAGSEPMSTVDDLELPYPLIALMIADVLARSDDGHVLVFLPGWDEIKAVHQTLLNTRQYPLRGLALDDREQYEIHVLHSSIPVQDQQAVFEPVRHAGIRRIILSTNIAETSITIPDVVFVVDSGRVKEKRYDPERRLSSLVSAWVGTSNLNQRAGRAGRHRPGEYYGVLSKARYDRLSVHQTVEMKRVDLSNVVMHIKALDIPGMDVEAVLAAAIEPPAAERVTAALRDLERVGAMDFNQNLTSLGKVLQQLPLDVSIGKMCLYGAFFRCLDPVLLLAAILTNRDPFMAPMHLKREANIIKDSFCPPMFRSDALCVLNAFYEWTRLQGVSSSQASRFLTNNMLSRATMMQIQQVKQNLFQSLEKADVIKVIRSSTAAVPRYRRRVRETDPEFNTNAKSTPLLCALIAVAMSPNFAIRSGERSLRTSQDKSCFVHPASVCHAKFTKDKEPAAGGAFVGDKKILAFSEKIRNTSGQTASSSGNAMTFLRSCTRLDPLTYMLFGASDARVLGNGLECDSWLPVTGHYDTLDTLERLKHVMDTCMLRIFEGIGKRRLAPPQPAHTPASGTQTPQTAVPDTSLEGTPQDSPAETPRGPSRIQLTSWNSDDEADTDDQADALLQSLPPPDRSLSPRELEEFDHMTTAVVQILDHYATEQSWDAPHA
ncbi:RNA helicase [Malassezia sp. CBS 17886]|nr:RNA helicase [Malassezia sp. CBS 17886]